MIGRMAIGVMALSLSAGLLVTSVQPSSAQAHRTFTAPSAVTVLATLKVDVDGDGRKDTVTAQRLGADQYRLIVRTTKGRTVRKTVTVSATSGGVDWYGAARLDGAKGYELIMVSGGEEEVVLYNVVRWRKGRLVKEAAPTSPDGSGWGIVGNGASFTGYRFFTAKGHRYVDAADLSSLESGTRATIFRSVWKSGKWRKISSRVVSMSNEEGDKYFGFQNVTIVGRS